jgi:hypothetical protein
MKGKLLFHRKTLLLIWLLVVFPVLSGSLCAQSGATVPSAADKPSLLRKEATDPATGIHYVRLSLSLPPKGDGDKAAPPRFTVQCEEVAGKHRMLWFLSFGGVEDSGFDPPFRPTPTDLYPPHYPATNIKMIFDGYIKSKPFTRSWSILPSGELRFRNSGSDSPNMETPEWFLQYLRSLPGLRVVHAKLQAGDPGELFFPLQPLLDVLNKTPACLP